jgi:RND family efflux transporter MFP subunit
LKTLLSEAILPKSGHTIALSLAAVGIIGLGGCGKGKANAPIAAAAVEVVNLSAPNSGETIQATGALRRQREMVLSFRIPGVITSLGVDDGDTVRAGQILARLDPTAVESRLRQARADLDRARRDEARYAKLAETGFVSRQRIEAQSAAASSAQAAYDSAAFDRRWASLVAPSSGVVLARAAQSGEVVQPGQAVLSLADQTSPLILRVPLSDRDIGKVRLGTEAQITLDALPGQALTGKVSRIGQRAGAQSGAIEIDIALPAKSGLRSGLIATAKIAATGPATTQAGFARLPAEAILEANGAQAFIMQLDAKTQTARRTQVVFGGFDGDDALVKGVDNQARIITAGAGFVNDGQKVRVVDPASLDGGQ